jgi:transposase
MQLSEAEIRAIYAGGEEAVVSLVSQLLERLNSLEAEVKELKGRLNQDSRNNSSKSPSLELLANVYQQLTNEGWYHWWRSP